MICHQMHGDAAFVVVTSVVAAVAAAAPSVVEVEREWRPMVSFPKLQPTSRRKR